jgi:hypothetical protein
LLSACSFRHHRSRWCATQEICVDEAVIRCRRASHNQDWVWTILGPGEKSSRVTFQIVPTHKCTVLCRHYAFLQ